MAGDKNEKKLAEVEQKIVALDSAVELATTALTAAIETRNELFVERSWLLYSVKPGVRVVDPRGKVGIVSQVIPSDWPERKPRVEVHPLKKDGQPSASAQTFWEWELVS